MTNPQVSDLGPGTAEDLVHDAHALGVKDASTRMITNWVEVGLLASPDFAKSTQRGRDPGVFPARQRQLFHELLKARQRSPLKRVPHHTMIPVVLLLWLTSDDIVCAAQASRALRTHARATGKSNEARRRDSARQILDQFAHPTATYRQRRTAQLLLEDAAATRRPDWGKIHTALTAACSPWRSEGVPLLERGIGLPGNPMTVTDAVVVWAAQQRVTARLAQEAVAPTDLLQARTLHREQWAAYEANRAALEAQSMTSGFFAKPDDAEAQAREQASAYAGMLAGVLGIIGQVAAEARAGGVPQGLSPDGRIAPSSASRRPAHRAARH
ncbi:hypothetical protein ABZ502_17365 [Streptomyces abikoensis]|uniref:hypothetical protein n=1 Tax=Streptomyces abikoensis TaxID=97398 RepID=UPI0034102CAB